MISRLTAVPLTLGLLPLVTAHPVSHEEAMSQHKKQHIILDDLFTVKDLNDLLKSCSLLSHFPSSNADGQGSSGSITFHLLNKTCEWGKEQGRRIPFSETQDASQNAKEQGSITLPDGNTLQLGEEQGRRVILPKEQSYTRNNLEDCLKDGNSFKFGKEQGRRVGWSHEQGRRVGWSHEQGRRVGWSHEQGRRVGWSHEQGRRVGWSHEQGRRVLFGEKQGIKVGWDENQARQLQQVSSKNKNIQAAIESIYNTAVIEALCKAASDEEKAAVVASYVQQNLFDNFQGFTDICDLLNGSGASGSTGLFKGLKKLLKDEK